MELNAIDRNKMIDDIIDILIEYDNYVNSDLDIYGDEIMKMQEFLQELKEKPDVCYFRLDKFISNEETPVCTKNGQPVKIIKTDLKGNYPIVFTCASFNNKNEELVITAGKDGVARCPFEEYSLYFPSKKHKGWVNVYKIDNEYYSTSDVESSEEEAKSMAVNDSDYITTVPIEWEEN